MAVGSVLCQETHDLASADKTFYPLRIPVSHWQLRHYISTPEPDLLYYASGHDIFCLNTATKKRKHIATLPFEARCTASGYGWVCVGGEDMGHFAAIKLDGSGPRTLDVDSALPLENLRMDSGRRAASVKVERMGEDIVNSISIHRIQDEELHLDDIVAILTNNDKTVRMYSLPQNLETTVLDLPFAMNHSTVSPDGKTLLAVGDFNQAAVFQRQMLDTSPQIHKPHNRLTSASIRWEKRCDITLHASEPLGNTGYFTTAWSPNGQLVAVGSEGGYITVFDVNLLPKSGEARAGDGVVAIVPSSRPDWTHPYPGAVRSMIFSPEPWDLLIWAEDQDRICIGDLRTGLKTRQIVKLDPREEGMKTITVIDSADDEAIDLSQPARDDDEMEAEFIRRYRALPGGDATAVNFATEFLEERRRQRAQRNEAAATTLRSYVNSSIARDRSPLSDDPQGLTAVEQQVLEALRTTRQREEARSGGGTPRTVNYTSLDMFREASGTRSTTSTNRNSTGESTGRPISEILSGVADSFPELSRTNAPSTRPGSSHGTNSPSALPSFSALQDGVWGSSQRSSSSLVRLSDGSRLPRRRESVILTPPDTNSPSSSQGNGNGNGSVAATNRPNPTAPTERADEQQEAEDNPWRTIEEHMTLARGPLFESTQRSRTSATTNNNAAPHHSPRAEAEMRALYLTEAARVRERTRLTDEERQTTNASSGTTGNGSTRLPTLSRRVGDVFYHRGQFGSRVTAPREIGVRTAGLAMSADGRTLWAACEAGIFEIGILVKKRFFWPSVEPR